MGWKKYNVDTQEWDEDIRGEELWNKYIKLVDGIYSMDDWNNADDTERQHYSSKVVKKLILTWSEEEIKELVPYLYNARHVREWEILKDMM